MECKPKCIFLILKISLSRNEICQQAKATFQAAIHDAAASCRERTLYFGVRVYLWNRVKVKVIACLCNPVCGWSAFD